MLLVGQSNTLDMLARSRVQLFIFSIKKEGLPCLHLTSCLASEARHRLARSREIGQILSAYIPWLSTLIFKLISLLTERICSTVMLTKM